MAARLGDMVAPSLSSSDEEVVDAVIDAGRAMVAIAHQSLAECEGDVTLSQYRTLVVLAAQGRRRLADLADALGVSPSTATRMCDRLVRKQLIERRRDELDRREVNLALTPAGTRLVREVRERRRTLLRERLEGIPAGARPGLLEALALLSGCTDGLPEPHWTSGWTE